MMDFDFLNDDFLLAREWSLDVSDVQLGGQYGDLKLNSRHEGDITYNGQPQGTIEEPAAGNEDVLGIEWLESSDLGSFLDTVDRGDKFLPLEGSLLNLNPSFPVEDIAVKQLPLSFEQQTLLADSLVSEVDFVDALSSPVPSPDSPAQVTPVIKLESIDVANSTLSPVSEEAAGFDPADFIGSDLGSFESLAELEDSFKSEHVHGSPLSADSESLLSTPGPSSPESNSNLSSLIETSPELYKIITTSTAGKSRYSPYQNTKSKTNSKSSKRVRTRKLAEPVPECVIMEQINKKDRKKLQNKNAAIRYRMKKKEEACGVKAEVDELEEINDALKTKVEDLNREIKYMKNLMEEVCKAKGIII